LEASGSDPQKPPPPGGAASSAPAWKKGLALLTLLISAYFWLGGLVDSLQRPSVTDSLSLRQLELATLAAEVLPADLRPALIGEQPRAELARELERQVDAAELPAPAAQRLELALLRRGELQAAGADVGVVERQLRELVETVDAPRRPLLMALLDGRRRSPDEQRQLLDPWDPSLMLGQLGCEQLGGPQSACPAAVRSGRLLLILLGVSVLPVLLVVAGVLLLLRRLWLQLSGRAPTPPPLRGPPLSPLDVTLLIAGGFVILGEGIIPELVRLPLEPALQALAVPPIQAQGLQVLILYLGLMAAPLLILGWMLPTGSPPPAGGWLQWHLRPPATAFSQALVALLMVLPLVALSGWLLERVWGDPGGSNPLRRALAGGGPAARGISGRSGERGRVCGCPSQPWRARATLRTGAGPGLVALAERPAAALCADARPLERADFPESAAARGLTSPRLPKPLLCWTMVLAGAPDGWFTCAELLPVPWSPPPLRTPPDPPPSGGVPQPPAPSPGARSVARLCASCRTPWPLGLSSGRPPGWRDATASPRARWWAWGSPCSG
jgi:hypothetical protein